MACRKCGRPQIHLDNPPKTGKRNQPFREPTIMPFVKYFRMKG